MQGNRLILAALSGVAAMVFAANASANMSAPYGWYAEANAGSAKLSNKSYPGSSSSSGIGGNLNAGYKFMPYFAIEIGYSLYPNTSVKDSTGTKAGSDRHYSYDAVAKGILPIGASGAEAFAKLGAGRLVSSMSISNAAVATAMGLSSSSHSATGLFMGIGMQYYFMPEMAVVGQWARAQGNSSTGNEDLLSGGVSFIFD